MPWLSSSTIEFMLHYVNMYYFSWTQAQQANGQNSDILCEYSIFWVKQRDFLRVVGMYYIIGKFLHIVVYL